MFLLNLNGSKLYDYLPPAKYGLPRTACSHGMRLFAESRGYTVVENYTQLTDNQHDDGFGFDEYKAEINAGRPVMIHVVGHSMVGVGYDDPETVYLHDTWDNDLHSMTWGGAYAEMDLRAMTVIHLVPEPSTLLLAGIALLVLAGYARRRRPQSVPRSFT